MSFVLGKVVKTRGNAKQTFTLCLHDTSMDFQAKSKNVDWIHLHVHLHVQGSAHTK